MTTKAPMDLCQRCGHHRMSHLSGREAQCGAVTLQQSDARQCACAGFEEPTGCSCAAILAADKTRHFRGCPLREKYSEHPAAQCGDLLQLDSQHVCNKPKGHDGMHSSGAKSWGPTPVYKKSVESRKQPFIIELEEHRRAMETDDGGYRGQNANVEVRRVRDAVRFLLANALLMQPAEPTAAEREDARQKLVDMSYSPAELRPEPMLRDAVRRNARPVRRIIEQDAPVIVCLCGSTRFSQAFADANLRETLAGKIVLTVGSMTHSDAHVKACAKCGKTEAEVVGVAVPPGECICGCPFLPLTNPRHAETKKRLDALHRRKIEIADECLILNAIACSRCGNPLAKNPEYSREIPPFCKTEDFTKPCDMQPYIGSSTKSEIEHALRHHKHLRFLNPQGGAGTTLLHADFADDVDATMRLLGLA